MVAMAPPFGTSLQNQHRALKAGAISGGTEIALR
jgi:hypothetical protein